MALKARESAAHRFALLASCLIGFSLFLDLYFTQIILSPLAETFGTTVLAARYTMVAATAGVVFAPLCAGRLPQRKPIQVATLAAMALLAGVEAAAPGLRILIGMRFCQGILVGILFIQVMGRIATTHRPRFGALSNGLFVSSTTLGGFTSRFLPPALVDTLGTKATFLVLAAVLGLICIAVQVSPLPAAIAQPVGGHTGGAGLPAPVRRRDFGIEFLLGFCVLFSQASIYTYLPVRLAHAPFLLDNRHIALMAFVFLLGAGSAPLTGRVTRNDLSRAAIALFFGCMGAGALLTATANLAAIGAGLALFSIGAFAQQAMLSRRLTARAGAATPRVFAVYMSIYYMGGATGSYVSGDILASDGFAGVVLVVVGAALLGGTALYMGEGRRPTLAWRTALGSRPAFESKPRNLQGEP
jgi:predicted MFS family arabinose efflux permease